MTAINKLTESTPGSVDDLTGTQRTDNVRSKRSSEDNIPTANSAVLERLFEMDLPDLPASIRGVSLDQILKAIADESRRAGVKSSIEALDAQGDKLRAAHEQKLEALKQQIDELSEKDFWSDFCKAFQVIGAVFGAIASVATAAVGVMTGNMFLVAAGVVGTLMSIESTMSLATDGEISLAAGFTKLGKEIGLNDEQAKWFAFGLNMLVVVASVALSLGAAGAANATSKAVDTASKSAEALAGMAKISAYSNVASSITGIGSSISNGVLAAVEYNLAKIKADGVDIDALLEQLRAAMKVSEDLIESEMKTAENLMTKVTEIVEDCNATATAVLTAAPTTA